jgi:ubiquinone/menaquinone biosynthesis C-methylase UbiE
VAAAAERESEAVAAGRLRVLAGDASAIPLQDDEVDRVLTVNTVYFWPDLDAGLREIRRVLAPGGRVVIGIRDLAVMQRLSQDVFTLREPAELRSALERAGFAETAVQTLSTGAAHLVTGVRAAP